MTQTSLDSFLKKTILICFHFLAIATPLFFSFSTSELFEFNKMILVYGGAVILTGATVSRLILAKRWFPKKTIFDLPILLFFASYVISTVFSIHPYTSIFGYYSRFHGGLLSTIAYIAIYYSATTSLRKKDMALLLMSGLGSAVLVSIYASLEHFGHSISCLLASEGTSFDAQCWIQDVQSRVFATFGQPNWLAAYLIGLIPFGIISTLLAKKLKISFLSAALTVLFFLTLLFTKSRSGILGQALSALLMMAGGLYLYFSNNEFKKISKNRLFQLSSMTILIILACVFIGTEFTPRLNFASNSKVTQEAPAQPQLVTNRLDIGGTDSGEIRKIVWGGALDVWKRYPLIGSGVETFAYSYYLDRPVAHNMVSEWDFLYNRAHNEFLNILATMGLVGLATYLFLYLSVAAVCIKLFFSNNASLNDKLIVLAISSAILAMSVSNFFGFSTVVITTLAFILFAEVALIYEDFQTSQLSKIIKKTKRSVDSIKKSTNELTTKQYIILSIIGVGTGLGLLQVIRYWNADVSFANGKLLSANRQWEPAVANLSSAIKTLPKQADYYDELAATYSQLALDFGASGAATDAAIIASAAEQMADNALKLNPQQRNFYKTKARVYITLSQLNPIYLQKAEEILEEALPLSPTDAKLRYNLALVELGQEKIEEGISHLKEAISLKPNYESARFQLGQQYYNEGKIEEAMQELQYIIEKINPENTNVIETLESWQNEQSQ